MTNHLQQYSEICCNSYIVSLPCKFCFWNCLDCVMDAQNKNCTKYTCCGQKCVCEFHSKHKWQKLDVECKQIDKEIQEAKEASAKIFTKLMQLHCQ